MSRLPFSAACFAPSANDMSSTVASRLLLNLGGTISLQAPRSGCLPPTQAVHQEALLHSVQSAGHVSQLPLSTEPYSPRAQKVVQLPEGERNGVLPPAVQVLHAV